MEPIALAPKHEVVPTGVVEDVAVVGCEAFELTEADAAAALPSQPACILERLPARAAVPGGRAAGPRAALPHRLEWFCFPEGDVAPEWSRRRPPDRRHCFTLHDAEFRPLRGVAPTGAAILRRVATSYGRAGARRC